MATTTNALDALLYIRDGYATARWNFPDAVGSSTDAPAGIGNGVSLTYSFHASAPSYLSEGGFQVFDSTQEAAARDALAAVAEIADITFSEAGGVGQMTFALSSQSPGQGGYAYTPSYLYSFSGGTILSATEQEAAGDVWINGDATWSTDAWLPGHDGYATLLHEIGHALGLKHPFEAGVGGYTLVDTLDDESHTVMSYTMAPRASLIEVTGTALSYSWRTSHLRPSTFMPLDIEALQYLYGANTATRSGDTVYTWDTNAELLETIWDGGGIDTIDCSNQGFTCIIDLRAGNFSSIGLRQTDAEIREGLDLPDWFTETLPGDIYDGSDNLAIAAGVVIEKAIGGTGKDQITGNAANNTLKGGAGADLLIGNGGKDTLDGGTGNDTLRGGMGDDTYIVNASGDRVSELSGQGIDLIKASLTYSLVDTDGAGSNGGNVERLTLTGGNAINGTGNALANLITGNTAANTLTGNNGNDTLWGGAGKDLFRFDTAPGSGNLDKIADFNALDDTIQLENAVFTMLTATGPLSSAHYRESLAGTAADADDYILYETDTGALYYDANGNGAGGRIKIATLWNSATTYPTKDEISFADFVVV